MLRGSCVYAFCHVPVVHTNTIFVLLQHKKIVHLCNTARQTGKASNTNWCLYVAMFICAHFRLVRHHKILDAHPSLTFSTVFNQIYGHPSASAVVVQCFRTRCFAFDSLSFFFPWYCVCETHTERVGYVCRFDIIIVRGSTLGCGLTTLRGKSYDNRKW